ncbi:MAG TPA: hypothetical protein VK796_04575 [Cytophaga sp.]|jgi:hypothetical protein|nr:hypothetical protein [Cytophaga sp.]
MKDFLLFKKYTYCIVLLLLPSCFNMVAAQSNGIPDYQPQYKQAKNPNTYRTKISLLLFGVGVMSAGTHSGLLNVNLPYKTIDLNGVKTTHVFHGSSNHLFSNQSPEIVFGLDLSRPLYAFNLSAGMNPFYRGAFYSVGYGVNLYLGEKGTTLKEKTQSCNWIIRPSLNVNYFSFSTGSIGSISNTNTTIYILDTEAKPTFTYSTQSNHTSYSHTVHADNLFISYKQNQLGLEPKIAFCSNPYKKQYSIQLFASYFVPIFESSGLILTQKSNTVNKTNLLSGSSENSINHHNEINATYNNQVFKTVPFHANHIYIGVTFGITISN